MQLHDYGDYNISVVGPEGEEQQSYSNALHLHDGFGHHSAAPSSDVNLARGGNRPFSFDSSSSLDNLDRPQLPHLTTDLPHPIVMRPIPIYSTGTSHGAGMHLYTSNGMNGFPSSWVPVNEPYFDPHSPSQYDQGIDSSPNPAGLSPLQAPVTPVLGVDCSPMSPQFPSPGSQGSRASLNPSPSPNLVSHPLTPASAHNSLDRISDLPAIVRSSPVPQHTALQAEQHMHQQYRTVYGSENVTTTTAQGHYTQAPVYTGQTSCGLDAYSIPQMSSYGYHSTSPPSANPSYSPLNYSPNGEQWDFVTNAQRRPIPEAPADGLGPVVPQRVYRPHTSSDRRRYVEQVVLDPPVTFELQNPPQAGIPLRDALTSRFMRLKDRDDHMFINRGPSVSIRLVWEGYQPWSRQIPTRDFKSPPGPITRSKLAKNIAKTIGRFIDENHEREFSPTSDPRWKVGPGHITVDDLILVSLHHVSMGSWQANLRLARPFTA